VTATSRELVYQALNFEGPARAPRQLWTLPWAWIHHADEVQAIVEEFPSDFDGVDGNYSERARQSGDPYKPGLFTDDWGCTFVNIHEGVIGEVKQPLIGDWDADVEKVHIPREWLTFDPASVNRECGMKDAFIMAGCCPRPFERLQFLRGTEDLYVDLADPPDAMLAFMKRMHAFYCELFEKWAATDVDGVGFMDDWGSQKNLLISPAMWREIFKPMYRDFAEIAHSAGKKIFMHSDGCITSIYPDLVELGIDAVNSQLFCMGVENLAPFAGRITFWGEIDRQHLLPYGTLEDIDEAVARVKQTLWRNGGCIAQCEFSAGARPENVREVFAAWDRVTMRAEASG